MNKKNRVANVPMVRISGEYQQDGVTVTWSQETIDRAYFERLHQQALTRTQGRRKTPVWLRLLEWLAG